MKKYTEQILFLTISFFVIYLFFAYIQLEMLWFLDDVSFDDNGREISRGLRIIHASIFAIILCAVVGSDSSNNN